MTPGSFPILFITATRIGDAVLSSGLMHRLAEEIPNARHFPNVEHPNTFNRIMMGWLEAQRHSR